MKQIWAGMMLWVIFPGIALATSFYMRPFPETVQDAPIIVRGKPGTDYANYAEGRDNHQRIYTFTDFSIDEVLKGKIAGRTIIVRSLGGQMGNVGMQVPGSVKFQRGEDLVILLGDANADGSYPMRGMMMGKFNVLRDEDGEEYIKGPGITSDEGIYQGHNDTGSQKGVSKWTLSSLRSLIAEQAKEPQGSEKSNQIKPVEKSLPKTQPSPELASEVQYPRAGNEGAESSTDGKEGSRQAEHTGGLSLWLIGGLLALVGGLLLFLLRKWS